MKNECVCPWPEFSNYLMSVGLAAGLLALFSTSNKWITARIEQQHLACVGKREPPGQIDSRKSHQNTITYFYRKNLISVVKNFCIFFMDFLKLCYKTIGIKPKKKKETFHYRIKFWWTFLACFFIIISSSILYMIWIQRLKSATGVLWNNWSVGIMSDFINIINLPTFDHTQHLLVFTFSSSLSIQFQYFLEESIETSSLK